LVRLPGSQCDVWPIDFCSQGVTRTMWPLTLYGQKVKWPTWWLFCGQDGTVAVWPTGSVGRAGFVTNWSLLSACNSHVIYWPFYQDVNRPYIRDRSAFSVRCDIDSVTYRVLCHGETVTYSKIKYMKKQWYFLTGSLCSVTPPPPQLPHLKMFKIKQIKTAIFLLSNPGIFMASAGTWRFKFTPPPPPPRWFNSDPWFLWIFLQLRPEFL
jgi:hypothetical protein